MTIDERASQLLELVVRDYINTARPVGSSQLARQFIDALSPATIRNILQDLEEAGFVFQPHTSAGRVPTDKGYRYYVDHLNREDEEKTKKEVLPEEAQKELKQERRIPKALSRLAGTVAIAGWPDRGDILEAGWRELLDGEAPELAAMKEISQLVDLMDSHLEEVSRFGNGNAAVFIGEENPLFAAKHSSVIIRTVDTASGEKAVLVLAGSKRMPYDQHLRLLENVAYLLEEGTL